jgi:sulfur-carrier protein adenylyltransferase/sulfurtransferase
MGAKILIPTPLRAYTGNRDSLEIEGADIEQVLDNLARQYESLKRHLFTDEGKLRNFVNIYVNDEDIRYLQKEKTPVTDSDTISIVPSIAGGRPEVLQAVEPEISKEEIQRYSRHLIMPEVGLSGQKKLKAASVLCIGAGGLGSPLALYLTAAGVGRLGIVDFDTVDYSNLQRQILHFTGDVGRPKLESAREKLQSVNPHVTVETHETALTSQNALDIIRQYDIVADGTDNFPTRYLVNDACVLTGKPNVYGSVFRFEGQVSVFATQGGPCYRCLYPEPPPPGLVPSCAEGGVLGILPGLIGVLQATEVIKLILRKGSPLVGRLLLVDALATRFRELKLRRNEDCPVCGPNPTIKELIDYQQFCGITPDSDKVDESLEIGAVELKALMDQGEEIEILDVRNPEEYEIARIPGSKLIPLPELTARMNELDQTRDLVVHCLAGVRSARAVDQLLHAGFRRVRNLKGGIKAWSQEVDPSVPQY